MSDQKKPALMQSEPILTFNIISALIVSTITLAVVFGLDISDEQTAAVVGFAGALYAVVTAVKNRSDVYAPDTVKELVDGARSAKWTGADKPGQIK